MVLSRVPGEAKSVIGVATLKYAELARVGFANERGLQVQALPRLRGQDAHIR